MNSKEQMIIVVAGIPQPISDKFVNRLQRKLGTPFSEIVFSMWWPIKKRYNKEYSDKLYDRLSEKLKEIKPSDQRSLLRDARLVLLYVDKEDGSESCLYRKFGLEALVVPFGNSEMCKKPMGSKLEQNAAANLFAQDGKEALDHAKELLLIIAVEVGSRIANTCLLLPLKNFGSEACNIKDCIEYACKQKRMSDIKNQFKTCLKKIERSIKYTKEKGKRCFVDERGRVYQAAPQGKRHGTAPEWYDPDHKSKCVIRGRIRFGASFDAAFHYDCAPCTGGCHDSCCRKEKVSNKNTYLNISPNDHIRQPGK